MLKHAYYQLPTELQPGELCTEILPIYVCVHAKSAPFIMHRFSAVLRSLSCRTGRACPPIPSVLISKHPSARYHTLSHCHPLQFQSKRVCCPELPITPAFLSTFHLNPRRVGNVRTKFKMRQNRRKKPRLRGLLAGGATWVHFDAKFKAGCNDNENNRSETPKTNDGFVKLCALTSRAGIGYSY